MLIDTFSVSQLIDTSGQLESATFPLITTSLDTLNFAKTERIPRFVRISDSIKYSGSSNLKLFVDTKHTFNGKFWEKKPMEYYFHTIDSAGITHPPPIFIPSYNIVDKFPVYLVNKSDSIQSFLTHDGIQLVIQEVLTKNGIHR
ncbi:MAG: hypothetical protein HRT57_16895 [Crocinitomicaceae bacterium]|nr:hypothetical protein [Crocinitomicaceae bacterium]